MKNRGNGFFLIRLEKPLPQLYDRTVRTDADSKSKGGVTASGIIVPDPLPSQLHYHVIYHVPAEGVSIPHWKMCFLTPNAVREHIAELGQKAEPNTEWYEDGQVGIETPLH